MITMAQTIAAHFRPLDQSSLILGREFLVIAISVGHIELLRRPVTQP
jgi:hypothetical protein